MHEAVRRNFAAFLQPMEGKESCMYQDHLGKVTTGIGNLIDSAGEAWRLPRKHGASWVHVDDLGVEGTEAEVVAEWNRVKNDHTLKRNVPKARDTARLVLTEQGIHDLLDGVLLDYEATLKRHDAFSRLDEWPADAQLGLFSMAWAMGPGFGPKWRNFSACVTGFGPDFVAAADHCNMVNDWMIRRNAVNRGLFRNAGWAVGVEQPFDRLYLPIPGRRPLLKRGDTDATHANQGFDSDDSVTTAQEFLWYLEFHTGERNGVFDQATEDAVLRFQKFEKALHNNSEFAADGKIGVTTWAALGYVVPGH